MTTQTAAKSRRLSRKPAKRHDATAKRQAQSRPQLRDDFFPCFKPDESRVPVVRVPELVPESIVRNVGPYLVASGGLPSCALRSTACACGRVSNKDALLSRKRWRVRKHEHFWRHCGWA